MAGGGLIGSVTGLDDAPPAVTTIVAVPALEMRLAVTDAVSWVALTNFVVRAVAFHVTVEPETNPVPFTVRVKAAPPAAADAGLRLVMVGGPLMGSVAPAEDAPD